MVVEHLQAGVGQHALADRAGLRTHAGFVGEHGLQAAQVALVHLLPQRERVVEHGALHLRHRQRAVGEAARLLDLDEADRLAHRFQRAQPAGALGGGAVDFLQLRQQLVLRRGHIRERHILQPDLGARRVGELGRRVGRWLGQVQLFHDGIVGDLGGSPPAAVSASNTSR